MVRPISRCCSSPTHETVHYSPHVLLTIVDIFSLLLVEPVLRDMLCYARLQIGIVSRKSVVQYM